MFHNQEECTLESFKCLNHKEKEKKNIFSNWHEESFNPAQNDWKAFQSPSFQRASENNHCLPKKKKNLKEGGGAYECRAQQKQTGCRAAGCNWLANKRNARALCCTLSGCRRSVTQMLPDKNIRHSSSKTEILMSSFLVEELLVVSLCTVYYY